MAEEREKEKEAIIDDDVFEVEEEGKTHREIMMDKIVAMRGAGEEVEEETEEEETPEESEEVEAELEEDAEELVTLKVDGHEQQFTQESIDEAGRRALQKESTADKRLEEAAAQRKELEKIKAELAEAQQRMVTPRETNDDDLGTGFVDAVFDDTDKAAEYVNNQNKRIADLEATLGLMAKKEIQTQQAEHQNVVSYYHDNYGDIAGDDERHDIFQTRINQIAAKEPSLTKTEMVDKAATDTRRFYGLGPDEIAVDKEKTPRAPVKRAGTRVTEQPEAKPKTPMEKVNDMRLSRGMPPIPT